MNTFADSMTMFRRYLLHLRRYPALSLYLIFTPVAFLLLFVYVFGGTLGSGIGASAMVHLPGGGSRAAYAGYVAPGVLMLTIAGAASITAIAVAKDMTEGIIARFRTMAISRTSVLTGHVLGGVVQILAGVAVMVGLTIAVGFRPNASAADWLAFAAIVLLLSVAVTWLGVAMGLAAKTVETASNTPMIVMFLPFLGSSFVPTASMPAGLRGFAEYQPFTPANEAIRALLTGGQVGDRIWLTAAWCAGMALLGYVWARARYQRDPTHLYRTRRWYPLLQLAPLILGKPVSPGHPVPQRSEPLLVRCGPAVRAEGGVQAPVGSTVMAAAGDLGASPAGEVGVRLSRCPPGTVQVTQHRGGQQRTAGQVLKLGEHMMPGTCRVREGNRVLPQRMAASAHVHHGVDNRAAVADASRQQRVQPPRGTLARGRGLRRDLLGPAGCLGRRTAAGRGGTARARHQQEDPGDDHHHGCASRRDDQRAARPLRAAVPLLRDAETIRA